MLSSWRWPRVLNPFICAHKVSPRYYSGKPSPDLRILFCGSDDFSVTSLRTLAKAKDAGILSIKSLDVVCRPPKRTGRGLRNIKEVPIAAVAAQLNLAVHRVDTFKGWELPAGSDINLIIAVSFGLLIPARIIKGAAFGGLNVHPSMLPDFRGAAPIEHAILNGCSSTGVSLQTLHPTKFDHGKILGQASCDIGHLKEDVLAIKKVLGGIGAKLLVQGLADRAFLEPLQEAEKRTVYEDGSAVQERTAFKITSEDLYVDFDRWSADHIVTRQKVLGSLWSTLTNESESMEPLRIKWTGAFTKVPHKFESARPKWSLDSSTGSLTLPAADGTAVRVERFTIPGKPERTVRDIMQLLRVKEDNTLRFS